MQYAKRIVVMLLSLSFSLCAMDDTGRLGRLFVRPYFEEGNGVLTQFKSILENARLHEPALRALRMAQEGNHLLPHTGKLIVWFDADDCQERSDTADDGALITQAIELLEAKKRSDARD